MRIRSVLFLFILLLAAIPFPGFGQSSSTPFNLADKAASSIITNGSGGQNVGYARVVANAGATTPSGVAIFGYRPANVLVTEAGVPASPLMKNGRIYAEVGPGGLAGAGTDIGMAIANPGATAATISFTFTNSSGTDAGSGSYSLAAGQQLAVFLDQAPWNLPLNFQGTFSFTSTAPISVVALQLYNNARGEALITTLPVLDLDAPFTPSTTPAVLSQFADGVGWTTSVLLVNPTNNAITGNVQFLNSTGAAVSLTANGATASSFSYTVASHSSFKLLTAGASSLVQTGSVVVTPTSGAVTPVSLAVFSYSNGSTIVTQAGVPSSIGTGFRTYVEATSGFGTVGSYSTGFAVANASSTAGSITLDLFTPDGNATAFSTTLPITANGQFAKFLTDVFPSLTLPFQGMLRIRTSTPAISVVALRIRFNERGEFLETTTPATEENGTPTNAEVDFPQIVNGGGFTTQFVLFSGYQGQATSGTLQFVASNGTSMPLTLTSTINALPVVLTSINPTTAAVGATITLTGTGFTSSSKVVFTSTAGTTQVSPSSQTSTTLTAVVPSNAITGPVLVTNGSQSSSSIILQVTSSGGSSTPNAVAVSSGGTTTGADIFVATPAGTLTFYAVGTVAAGTAYPAPVTLSKGTSAQIFLVGSNFSSTSVISASGSGDVTVSGTQVSTDGTQMLATITISASAPSGPRNLIVTNSNGDRSILTGGLLIP